MRGERGLCHPNSSARSGTCAIRASPLYLAQDLLLGFLPRTLCFHRPLGSSVPGPAARAERADCVPIPTSRVASSARLGAFYASHLLPTGLQLHERELRPRASPAAQPTQDVCRLGSRSLVGRAAARCQIVSRRRAERRQGSPARYATTSVAAANSRPARFANSQRSAIALGSARSATAARKFRSSRALR